MSQSDPPETTRFLPGVLPDLKNVGHTKAVVALSIQFAKLMKESLNAPLNMDYIIAGAILHDLGKSFGFPSQWGEKIISLIWIIGENHD